MSPASSPPLRSRRRIPWAALIIGFVVALVLLPIVLFGIWRSGVSRDIAALEKKARDAGEPVTLEELAALRKPVPDEENVFVALMAIWPEEDPEFWQAFRTNAKPLPEQVRYQFDPELPGLGRTYAREADRLPWSAREHQAATEFVRTNAVRAGRVRAALARPHASFPVNSLAGFSAELPHLSRLKHEGQRLELAALLAIADQRGDAAVDALGQLFRLADCLRDEPYMLSQLVRMALLNLGVNAIEEAFAHARLSPAQLDNLHRQLRELDLAPALHRALLGERAMGVSVFTTPIKDLGIEDTGATDGEERQNPLTGNMSMSSSPMNAVGYFAVDRRLMLQTFDRLMELTRDGNWDDILKTEEVVREAVAAADTLPPKIMTGLLLPALAKGVHKFVGLEARRRCALLALEVERFRQANADRLPDSLDELPANLSAELPTDPYTGQPLRYAGRTNGYVIYSLGPDQRDQQGATVAPRGQPAAYDVAFTVGTGKSSVGE